MRHKSGPMEIGEMAVCREGDDENEWGDVHAVGYAKGKAQGKGKNKDIRG